MGSTVERNTGYGPPRSFPPSLVSPYPSSPWVSVRETWDRESERSDLGLLDGSQDVSGSISGPLHSTVPLLFPFHTEVVAEGPDVPGLRPRTHPVPGTESTGEGVSL